jgi:hypothetical protein
MDASAMFDSKSEEIFESIVQLVFEAWPHLTGRE